MGPQKDDHNVSSRGSCQHLYAGSKGSISYLQLSQSAPLEYPHNGTMQTLSGDFPPSRCCTILLEEIAPAGSSVMGGDECKPSEEESWKLPLDRFTPLKEIHKDKFRKLPKSIRRYYKAQDDLINAFENIELDVDDAMENSNEQQALLKTTKYLSILTFFTNLILLVAKLVAAILSGSLSVVSSLIDSAVDLISGALMYWSARAVKYRDIYQYPQGRTRLEPLAIVILSVIMALASVQMIREATQKIIQYTKSDIVDLTFGIVPICICIGTIVLKLILFLLCRRHDSPSLQALALDHRNDILSNSVALACGLLGYRVWSFADPIGAIVISMYIIGSWAVAGWAQIKMLTGYTARPEFLTKITWVCLNHHAKILMIDTVRAFHFGCNFIVEVDIVLPESMSVREAHDIAESLQQKIERMPQVERSFVHVDYECDHAPHLEHKVV
ncbi:Metal tolerance protein 10 [Lamellibrachia satsuma]|nr:Metal tolerance protein 10 [Lamellibrachia satsuma]